MKSKELKKLYDSVRAKYDIGDYETFLSRMQTVDGRKKFHSAVSKVYDIGTFEDMEKRLSSSGCAAGGKKDEAGICKFSCLDKLKKFKVKGKPEYKMGGGIYTFYTSGNYKFVGEDPKNSKNGTWACNTNGFTEIDGQKPSFIPQFEWVVAPTEEEVKTGKRLLKSGMRGDFVTKVQQQLKVKGVDPKGVDGKFGKNTKNAVIKFQETVELNNDGVVGPKTYQELFFEVPKTDNGVNPVTDTQAPSNIQTQSAAKQPGLKTVYEPKSPEIQRQQPTVPPLTNKEQRKANRMTRTQQNAHVDPQPVIRESLKKNLKTKLVEKTQEKENLLIESKITTNRFKLISEGLVIETDDDKIRFVETVIQETNYLVSQGYTSKSINEGLFSALGGLFGGSLKAIPAVFGEYIAKWLTKTLGVPQGSFIEGAIMALVGNLNIADYDKFFTDCRFASNKIADSLIEGYLIQMQNKMNSTSQGASGFIVSALRNAVAENFLEDKEGIIQILQDKIGDFLCPKLAKVSSVIADKTEEIKDKAVA